MSIWEFRQMGHMTREAQALKAIDHVLKKVREDQRLAHLIGLGSQSFDLLTEAYCALNGRDLSATRKVIAGAAAAEPQPPEPQQAG